LRSLCIPPLETPLISGRGRSIHGRCSFFSGGSRLLNTHLNVLAGGPLLLADSVLGSTSFTLSLEFLLTDLLGLHLVNLFDQDVLVLELVTLGGKIELVVDVSGDLLSITVLLKETTENTLSSHPQNLSWHTGVSGTLPATGASMTSLSLGLSPRLRSGARVNGNLTFHDETVLVHLSNVLAYRSNEL